MIKPCNSGSCCDIFRMLYIRKHLLNYCNKEILFVKEKK